MGKSSPPPPPDPSVVAAAQGAANKETAVAQTRLNMVDQNNPDGTVRYSEIPGSEVDGVPRYRADVSLSPGQQRIYDQNASNSLNLGILAGTGIENAEGVLSSELDLSDTKITKGLVDAYQAVYGEQNDKRRADLEANLVNRGIRPGSEAYDRSVRGFQQGENDRENQLFLSGRQQEMAKIMAERNQPINEITALSSGSQVSNPIASFAPTPQTAIAPTDIVGPTYASYNGQVRAANAKNHARGQIVGGLFGMGAGLASGGYL